MYDCNHLALYHTLNGIYHSYGESNTDFFCCCFLNYILALSSVKLTNYSDYDVHTQMAVKMVVPTIQSMSVVVSEWHNMVKNTTV